MAGIYIHIPFCRKACHYCNFHFSTSLALKNEFIVALLKEVEISSAAKSGIGPENEPAASFEPEPVETIYFGGGTPSLLSFDELKMILSKIHQHYIVEQGAEVTLEANPDDITSQKLKEWRSAGVNRLSIGVQSFFDDDLKWMNRVHNAAQAITSILTAQQEGFENITIDLIYGTPLLTNERWKQNVDKAVSANVPHLACYALTVEPSTALYQMIVQKKTENIDSGKQAEQFLLLMDWLETAGYEHYEISNFARPGMRSRHNSGYWTGKHYFGFGPSAHSFNGICRQWNVANNALYIQSINNNTRPLETENLSDTEKLNEYVMTSLRTTEGTDLNFIKNQFGEGATMHIKNAVRKYITARRVTEYGSTIKLTREGKLYADGIAADLFI